MTVKVAVRDVVRSAIVFARASLPRVAGVLALVMVLNIAGDMAASRPAQVLTFVAAFLVSLMANAALFRLAFADEHPGDEEFRVGPQGLQFAMPEMRLFGSILLILLFLLLAFLFFLLVLTIVLIAQIAAVHGSIDPTTAVRQADVQATMALLALALGVVLVWAVVRLCLYPAATVAEKRVQVFSTWKLTAGNWWRILAAFVILILPALVTEGLLRAAQGQPALLAGFAILAAAVNAFVEVPLFCGLYADLYKRLRGGPAATAVPPAAAPGAPSGLAGPWG